MKKLTLLLLPIVLFALSKPQHYSPLPVAQTTVVNLNPFYCDDRCLIRLLDDEKHFSFVARFEGSNNPTIKNEYLRHSAFLNVRQVESGSSSGNIKMAILIPSQSIGRYSVQVVNSVTALLLQKDEPFELRVFDSIDESYDSLRKAFSEAQNAGFRRIIAALTLDGTERLMSMPINMEVFIPTVNRNELSFYPNPNLFFGGIDYGKQLTALSKYRGEQETISFDENSQLSQKISALADATYPEPPSHVTIDNPRVNFKKLFTDNNVEHGTTLLLNTQPVRSSLILSQITYNDINISSALSTQINYNPLILSLTQAADVERFFVASVIGESDKELVELNTLFQNDIKFNWIPYATTVLTELALQRQKGNFDLKKSSFKQLEIINNQIDYPVTIYQIKNGKFTPALEPIREPQTAW